ncbi:MAG: hypothetical protein ACLR23_04170 [Clostridia bacterium]
MSGQGRIIVIGAIDNLVKGAAGQADSKYESTVRTCRKPWAWNKRLCSQ